MIILHTCVTICGLFMNSIADIIPLYHAVSLKLDDSFSFSVVIIVARFSRQPWSERAVMKLWLFNAHVYNHDSIFMGEDLGSDAMWGLHLQVVCLAQ